MTKEAAQDQKETTHPLLAGIKQTFSAPFLHQIQSSRILLVGAGGIGCELLKNLALCGFRNIEIIDLDTIDVSNLNRQFLFRSHHVGMSKCEVASKVAWEMLPDKTGGEYKAHLGNVCDTSKFTVPYIASFNLVLNALDNITARRRVNRLCLAANTPLVEAGTTGYLGQVTVIDKKSNVECYECKAKPTQKVYPICTIRSTPSQPVHTIVWAKELWKLLFGGKVEDSMLFEDEEIGKEEGEENGEESKDEKKDEDEEKEKSTYMDHVLSLRSLLLDDKTSDDSDQSAKKEKIEQLTITILHALYGLEITKQLNMDRFKTAQKLPKPLSLPAIQTAANQKEVPSKKATWQQTDIWTLDENIQEFLSCIIDAHTLVQNPETKKLLLPEFDKDDDLSMRFITCASNIRSIIFDIQPVQSYYGAKGIAGNIVPAIATTNAIVAGLQVLQVFHILRRQMESKEDENDGGVAQDCRYTYCLRDKTRKGYYLQPTSLPEPNPQCFVCRNATLSISLNTTAWTMTQLLKRILKKELGFESPTILLGDDIIHEEGDGADEEAYKGNLEKVLCALPCGGIKDGVIVRVEDFTQDMEVDLCFTHKEDWTSDKENEDGDEEEKEETEKFVIGGKKPLAKKSDDDDGGENEDKKNDDKGKQADADDDYDDIEIVDSPSEETGNKGDVVSKEEGKDEDDDDDIIEIVEPSTGEKPESKKRKHDDDENGDKKEENVSKKSKVEKDEVEVIELD